MSLRSVVLSPRSLADELQQRGFTSRQAEAFLSVLRTADVLDRMAAAALKPHGLTPTQYNVLRILRGAGADGRMMHEIGERLVNHDPDVTRLVDRMEKRGLLRRERLADDRRCVKAFITPEGRALVDRLDAPIHELHLAAFRDLGAGEQKALIEALGRVREAVEGGVSR